MPVVSAQKCTTKDNLLIRKRDTKIVIECNVEMVGTRLLYARVGKLALKFSRATGKGYLNDYSIIAWGNENIEAYRKKTFLENEDAESDRSRLEIPKADADEGTLTQIAELLARRVSFHWSNKDFDGAIRLLHAAKEEHLTREKDLSEAAKCNGVASPLSLLGLPVKITNALERAGCKTIFDLCIRDGGSLMLGAGLGPTSYEVVRRRLDEHGFDHRMETLKLRKPA